MASFNNAFAEGQSIVRPPMFNGEYAFWKNRMNFFLKTIDAWDIVETGYRIPTITVDDQEIEKPKEQWTELENKLQNTNAKATNSIICSLDQFEFNRVSHCLTAQEIWHILEVTHEGTSQVKESRLAMLSSEYENFTMAKEENVKEMHGRLSNIVYKSKAFGKSYTELEIVRKILRVLPRKFEAKVTAIQESKDLKQMKVEELIGNLTTYELEMKFKEEREGGDTRK